MRGGSRLVTIHGRNTRNQRDSRDCIIQGWTEDAPSHVTADPRLQARMYTHRSTGRSLTARHKNNFETAVADIRASERLRKKTKGKDAPAEVKER